MDAGNPDFSSLDGVLFNKDKTCLVSYPGGKAVDCVIPGSATSIGAWAFARCYNIESVTIPDSVASIGDGAFLWCDSLADVTLPGAVTKIGSQAFRGCAGLRGMVIPAGVTDIGNSSLSGCSALTEVFFKGDAPPRVAANALAGSGKAIIYYLPETKGWGATFAGCSTVAWDSKNPPRNATGKGTYTTSKSAVQGWDVRKDFSFANNPNGVWSYGWNSKPGTPIKLYADNSTRSGMENWITREIGGCPLASVNRSGSPNGFPLGVFLLHSGPSGQYSVARWTSPHNGRIIVKGVFGAGHSGKVDVMVFQNDRELFKASDTAKDEPFEIKVDAMPGDKIDFIVGAGSDYYTSDSTPLEATITPE